MVLIFKSVTGFDCSQKQFYFFLPLTRQMRRLLHKNRISHSDIHIRFSNVRPNLSVATSFDTGNGRILLKRVHRSENVPEVQKNHYIIA